MRLNWTGWLLIGCWKGLLFDCLKVKQLLSLNLMNVLFLDQFVAGLRMLCQDFVEEILKANNIEMHHLTPNRIAKIALFIWTVKS